LPASGWEMIAKVRRGEVMMVLTVGATEDARRRRWVARLAVCRV